MVVSIKLKMAMDKNKPGFQPDRDELFEDTEIQSVDQGLSAHFKRNWGSYTFYAIAAVVVACKSNWWLEAYHAGIWMAVCVRDWVVGVCYWYVDGLSAVKNPIMSLSILDILGLLTRVAIGAAAIRLVVGIFRTLWK